MSVVVSRAKMASRPAMARPDGVVDQLLDAVWKEGSFVTPRSIDVFVRRLREKIERDPRHPRYLKTLRGIGYRFENGR